MLLFTACLYLRVSVIS